MKIYSIIIVFIASLFFASCTKDSNEGGLNFSAKLVNNQFAASKTNAPGTVNFTGGYVWLSEIDFDGDISVDQSVSKTISVDTKIDFATGIADPPIGDINVPLGDYNSFSLALELRDTDAQPCIVMEGTYTNNAGNDVPIRFEFNSGEVFEVRTGRKVILSDQVVTTFIEFDPSVWFSVITSDRLENAVTDNAGSIVISGNNNSEIFDDVADRLDVSTDATAD